MYFGRYPESENNSKSQLPLEWTEEFTRSLTEAYFDQSEKDNCFFDVYGEIYDKEFVVITSYINHKDPHASPISIFISHDVEKNSKEFKKVLNNLVDFVGLVFDDIFSQKSWNDYNLTWTENEYRGSQFHYKITRENISLTIQAEEILKKGEVL